MYQFVSIAGELISDGACGYSKWTVLERLPKLSQTSRKPGECGCLLHYAREGSCSPLWGVRRISKDSLSPVIPGSRIWCHLGAARLKGWRIIWQKTCKSTKTPNKGKLESKVKPWWETELGKSGSSYQLCFPKMAQTHGQEASPGSWLETPWGCHLGSSLPWELFGLPHTVAASSNCVFQETRSLLMPESRN